MDESLGQLSDPNVIEADGGESSLQNAVNGLTGTTEDLASLALDEAKEKADESILCIVYGIVIADEQALAGRRQSFTSCPHNEPPHWLVSVRQSSCTQILKMKRYIAEEEFIRLGSFVVKVQVVFPGKAYPTMNLH